MVDVDKSRHDHLVAIFLEDRVELCDGNENSSQRIVQNGVIFTVKEKSAIHYIHEE